MPSNQPAARLKQQLFAFERVSVESAGSVKLSFDVTPDQLELFSAAGDRMVYPGDYTLKFSNGVDAVVTKDITVHTPGNVPLLRERLA